MKPAGMLKSSAAAPAFQPLYRQIKHLITQSLVSGEWRPGDPIPSEIELASRYSVSQGTVRKAVSELAGENLRRFARGGAQQVSLPALDA
jgi:GntR family transcriptional regulator